VTRDRPKKICFNLEQKLDVLTKFWVFTCCPPKTKSLSLCFSVKEKIRTNVFYYISRLAESLLVQVLDWLQNIVKQGHNHEEFNELIDWSDFWVTLFSAEGIYLTTVYEDKGWILILQN
jgi:hypothetical protein